MKLSIIIPYYKTLSTTSSLLTRLQAIKTKDVEIILIDDSQDGNILSSLVDKYIYNETNLGTAGSRNRGLDIAEGEYITFIDCDDSINKNYIKEILKVLPQHNDLTWISWDSIYGNAIARSTKQINIAPWGCIFKRKIFDNIRFNDKMNVGEEPEFWDTVYKQFPILQIGYINKVIYHYIIRTDSATRRYDRKELPKFRE